MFKSKAILSGIFSGLLLATFMFEAVPAQAQTQPPNATPTPEGLSTDDWAQIDALLPESAAPYAYQAYLKASNTGANDTFGYSMAVSGNIVVVGARSEDSNATGVNGDQTNDLASNSGAVYVFVRSGNTWTQQAYLKASNTEAKDEFGTSVSIYGNTIVVGAPGEDSAATGVNGDQSDNSGVDEWGRGPGAAYVFTRTGSIWSQQAYLKASNADGGDTFGVSVAITADTIAVGATGEDSSAQGLNGDQSDNSGFEVGAAYIFTRNNGVWSQQVYVKSSPVHGHTNEWYDNFGAAMAFSGNTLVVGETGSFPTGPGNGNCGAAYVFFRANNVWSEQAQLWSQECGLDEGFGGSVAISGNTIVIGAPGEDSSATGVNGDETDDSLEDSGAAYVFVRSAGNWQRQAYLKASKPDAWDRFGSAVAIFGNKIAVGATGEDSKAKGWNGNQGINAMFESGAVYSFARTGTSWNQHGYLKASNTNGKDEFGSYLAISSDDTLFVSAPYEASNAVGVNGNQDDNSASKAGAIYALAASPFPCVVYSTRSDPNPTSAASVNFTVSFSKAVSGVDVSDFAVATTSGVSNAIVTSVSGGPEIYMVTVSTGTGTGTIRLNVVDNDSIVDSGNIPLGGAGTGNGNFYQSETYIVRPFTQTFQSQATQDGWILESARYSRVGGSMNSTAPTFIVGMDEASREYRSILHFNTGVLPDTAVVTSAILKIKKHSQVGLDPFIRWDGIRVNLSKPRFGTGMNLQLTDFEAAPSVPYIVAIFDPTPVGSVYSAVFDAPTTKDLNLTGSTQLRLGVITNTQGVPYQVSYDRFYSGDATAAANRPSLVVEYYVP